MLSVHRLLWLSSTGDGDDYFSGRFYATHVYRGVQELVASPSGGCVASRDTPARRNPYRAMTPTLSTTE